MSVTLGIDIGTSGTKTVAIDEKGAILASASAEYPCDYPCDPPPSGCGG